MAIPIIHDWEKYFTAPHEGLGSSYERLVLNRLLLETAGKYGVGTALETPSFGFTGISGINLLALADAGVAVTLEDHDQRRLELVSQLWESLGRDLTANLNADYSALGYPDRAFGLSFSFSALWFVPDLRIFLKELSRVTDKVILISVPNREGIGYKLQARDYTPEKYPELRPANIDPASIIAILGREGWRLQASDWFDCPPWPDIGMAKEDFVRKFIPWCPLGRCLVSRGGGEGKAVSILDLYSGKDPGFEGRLLRHGWFERLAPRFLKRRWAHHYYLLFDRDG
jgi:hypothetical protein